MTPILLRFAALRETGIVGVLETPGPEQDQLATARYSGLHAQLLKDRLATWALTEDIPEGATQPVIWMLAFLCASVLGAPESEVARLSALGSYKTAQLSTGERMLRSWAAKQYVSQPARADYL